MLKISPDVTKEYLDDIINLVLISGLDGIIAANTTSKREGLASGKNVVSKIGQGGLSGKPLYERSLELVKYIYEKTNGHLPIIASGGIMTPAQAMEMLDSGASLIQVYTGFIYNGPKYAKKINKFIARTLQERQRQKEDSKKASKR